METGDLDRIAEFLFDFLDDVFDLFLVVLDERLFDQADLAEELVDPSHHHLLGDLGGLALGHRLLGQDLLFLVDDRLVQPVAVDRLGHARHCRRRLHRDILGQLDEPLVLVRLGLARGQADQHADAVAVLVVLQVVVAVVAALQHQAAQLDVLADLGDRRGQFLTDRVVLVRHRLDLVVQMLAGRRLAQAALRYVGVHEEVRHLGDQRLEVVVSGDEVGLSVDDQHHALAVVGLLDADQALVGRAVGFFGGLGQALLAQRFDRRVHIAAALRQRFLALHHAQAGGLAQVHYHFCCYLSHCLLLLFPDP